MLVFDGKTNLFECNSWEKAIKQNHNILVAAVIIESGITDNLWPIKIATGGATIRIIDRKRFKGIKTFLRGVS